MSAVVQPARGFDVMRARVAFRDRPILDVLDLALRFLVVHATLYARVALVVLLPCLALTMAAASAFGWLVGWGVALLCGLAAQVPFTVLASRVVFQERVLVRDVLRDAAREVPRIVVVRVLATIVLAVTSVLFVGVWLAALALFVNEVMLLERARALDAIGRSQRIASSSMGDAFAGVAITVALPLLAILLADVGGRALVGELLQFRAPAPLWAEGGSFLALVGWFGAIPYVTTTRFFTYLNARTHVEGWDIQTRFAALAARAGTGKEDAG